MISNEDLELTIIGTILNAPELIKKNIDPLWFTEYRDVIVGMQKVDSEGLVPDLSAMRTALDYDPVIMLGWRNDYWGSPSNLDYLLSKLRNRYISRSLIQQLHGAIQNLENDMDWNIVMHGLYDHTRKLSGRQEKGIRDNPEKSA